MVEPARRPGPIGAAFVIGGGLVFAASLAGLLWHLAPDRNLTRDGGPWTTPAWGPIAIDVALFSAFALHHSVFARTSLKDLIARHLPRQYERSLYVWIASAMFVVVWSVWQPVPGRLWAVGDPLDLVLRLVQLAGVVISIAGARRVDAFDLAGLRSGLGLPAPRPTSIADDGLYKVVRHPIYVGWLLIVWASPVMTGTLAVFAAVSTAYLVVAIPFEERDLTRTFGAAYTRYQARVRWRLVPFVF